jgi:hypothetical protein
VGRVCVFQAYAEDACPSELEKKAALNLLSWVLQFGRITFMRAVELMVRSILPPDLRDMVTDLDEKTMNKILVEVYKRYPDSYREISKKLGDLGRNASYRQGETIGMRDLVNVTARDGLLAQMDKEIAVLKREFKNDPELFAQKREEVWLRYNDLLQKNTVKGAIASGNNIGYSVFSGARGKAANIQAMLTTPGLYQDAEGRTIPVFVRNSFAEGLRPYEYMAGTYGARSSVISTKSATAKGGDLGKLYAQTAGNLVVTEKDCGVQNGMAYDIEDSTARNRILSKDTGSLKAGTLLDRQALAQLRKEKVGRVFARSPLTCKADGLCSACVGKTFENKFPEIGEHVGITAANALCLEENVRVMLADGFYCKVKDIQPGDLVIGLQKDGTFKPVKVLQKFYKGEKDCNLYEFKHYRPGVNGKGFSVTCTPEHNFGVGVYDVSNKEIDEHLLELPIGELERNRKGKKLRQGLYLPETPLQLEDTVDFELAFLLGILLGDGTFNDRGGLSLSCYDSDLSNDLQDYLSDFGLSILTPGSLSCLDGVGKFHISASGERGFEILGDFKRYLKNEMLWDARALNKWIPEEAFTKWSLKSVLEVLAGLLITDGNISKNGDRIKFCTSSYKLAIGIEALLKFRLLIPGVSLHTYHRKDGNTEYEVRVTSFRDVFRVGELLLPYMRGVKRDLLKRVLKGGCKESRVRSLVFLDKVTPVGLRRTYDIQVDSDTHMFLLEGGLITHNSEPVTQGALCLGEGTRVRMADDSVKEIQQIEVGEWVMGSTIKGERVPVQVLARHENGEKEVYDISFGKYLLTCTPDHKVLTRERYSRSLNLEKVYKVKRIVLARKDKPLKLPEQTQVKNRRKLPTYDLTVAHPDHLFVLENGMVVSNSAKHTAGQAKGKKTYGGFEILSQFVQSPQEYSHKAAVAPEGGYVTSVEEAPQGGYLVKVNESEVYVPSGYPVLVKVGDEVDPGDQLSEGIVDIRDVVDHKGLGEARRYYVDRLTEIYQDSGLPSDKKNLEIFAKGALADVVLEDELEGLENLPDDRVNYNRLSRVWKPKNVRKVPLAQAGEGWLAKDVLHHTGGTKLNRKQVKELNDYGIAEVDITDEKPPFVANMTRLRTASHSNPDWLASMSTSYLKDQLLEGATRGADTNYEDNQHWAPRLAYGKGFGENIRQTGKF